MLRQANNPLQDCEIKMAGDGSMAFTGYASKFNGNDTYNDTVLPGAFKETLADGHQIHGFINHRKFDIPSIDWTLIEERKAGLWVEGEIDPKHREGESLHSAMKRKAMSGLSIGYRIPKGGAEEKDDDSGGLILKNIHLVEISVVTQPADDKARVSNVKSAIETIETLRDFETWTRDALGFDANEAKAFISRFKDLVKRRDADDQVKENTDALVELFDRYALPQIGDT